MSFLSDLKAVFVGMYSQGGDFAGNAKALGSLVTPYVTVEISTEQLRTLSSLPVEVIPAPGEGLIAIYEKYVTRSSLATEDFSSGISLQLRWKNAPNNDALSLNAQFGVGFPPMLERVMRGLMLFPVVCRYMMAAIRATVRSIRLSRLRALAM